MHKQENKSQTPDTKIGADETEITSARSLAGSPDFSPQAHLAHVLLSSPASVDKSVYECALAWTMAKTERGASSLPKKWALCPLRKPPHILWLDGWIFSFCTICGCIALLLIPLNVREARTILQFTQKIAVMHSSARQLWKKGLAGLRRNLASMPGILCRKSVSLSISDSRNRSANGGLAPSAESTKH
jgi:hypothetical protein